MSRYNDAVQRLGQPDKTPPAAYACAVSGCPLAGSVRDTVSGAWRCRHHVGVLPIFEHGITEQIRTAAPVKPGVSPVVREMLARVRRPVTTTVAPREREPGEEG